MATCQTIITRALQKLGIVGAGGTPLTDDNTLGLETLIGLYQGLINKGASGAADDTVLPSGIDYTAHENERIVHDGTCTITLPTQIAAIYVCDNDYGLPITTTDTSAVRTPMDMAFVSVVRTDTGAITDYLYDNRIRDWVELNALSVSNEAPLSHRDPNGLSCLLSLYLADYFGPTAQPGSLTAKAAYDFQLALAQNFSQAGEIIDPPCYF